MRLFLLIHFVFSYSFSILKRNHFRLPDISCASPSIHESIYGSNIIQWWTDYLDIHISLRRVPSDRTEQWSRIDSSAEPKATSLAVQCRHSGLAVFGSVPRRVTGHTDECGFGAGLPTREYIEVSPRYCDVLWRRVAIASDASLRRPMLRFTGFDVTWKFKTT